MHLESHSILHVGLGTDRLAVDVSGSCMLRFELIHAELHSR